MLTVGELLYLLGFVVKVALSSVKLFLPSLGKMVGTQIVFLKSS